MNEKDKKALRGIRADFQATINQIQQEAAKNGVEAGTKIQLPPALSMIGTLLDIIKREEEAKRIVLLK